MGEENNSEERKASVQGSVQGSVQRPRGGKGAGLLSSSWAARRALRSWPSGLDCHPISFSKTVSETVEESGKTSTTPTVRAEQIGKAI